MYYICPISSSQGYMVFDTVYLDVILR